MEKLNFETIKKYQSFATIEEMDKAVRGFLYEHKSALSEGTIAVLKVIWRHSAKVIGVSFASNDYLADEANVSRRTVIRAVNTLVEKGLIKRISTARMNGKQGANILVIQPYTEIDTLKNKMSPHDDTPSVTANKTENKQSSLCENKINTKRINDEPTLEQLDTSFLPESVSKEFVEAARPFFNVQDIYELWRRVEIVYEKMQLKKDLDDVMDTVVQAFKETVFAKKLGRIKSTFRGYFYRILYAKLIVEKRREIKPLLFDFLNN
ncbi:DNA-binding Lrp family transcriptional regulator [Metabacillus malikii]|uniref:DNA-binding Lrp family transcriptional regulator n=2 Tax=Metabacillus malikii TaxID=1504265 RepID=A0ABT9ZGF7_9BACI|nr:DNA-binding Lrp family transcriptional regulator [Metabacillus malikii]